MKLRSMIVIGSVAALAGTLPSSASAACAGETTPAAAGSQSEMRAAVVCLVNEARTARGLTPLASESRLEAAAQAHADDMRAKSYFAHQGLLGPGLADRITARGYDWSTIGENIARGQQTPFEVVEAWLASSGHCKNILGAFSDIGIGVNSSRYWVQDFGVQQRQTAGTKGGSCTTSLGRSAEADAAPPSPSPDDPPAAGSVAGPTIRKVLAVSGSRRAVRVSVACPAGRAACTGKLRLRLSRRGTVLATRAFSVPSGGTRPVIVRVSSGAEARLRRASRRSVRLELHAPGQATRARTVQLSAAR